MSSRLRVLSLVPDLRFGNEDKKFARLQLLTIEGLMTGTQRAAHPDAAPANCKQAKKEAKDGQPELLEGRFTEGIQRGEKRLNSPFPL